MGFREIREPPTGAAVDKKGLALTVMVKNQGRTTFLGYAVFFVFFDVCVSFLLQDLNIQT